MASKLPMRALRIEDGLYEKVCQIAKSEKRSFNAEVAYILERFVQQYGAIQSPEPAPAQEGRAAQCMRSD